MKTDVDLSAAFAATPGRASRPVGRKTRLTICLDDEVIEQFRTLSGHGGTATRV